MGGSEGLRHRQQQQQQKPVQEDSSVTPEQRQVVQQILAAKGFYDVLGVPKDAAESDIKQAYRKVGGLYVGGGVACKEPSLADTPILPQSILCRPALCER
jgi:gamma-glutamyl-gamma-aminobutyrate hydrolase PuuD